MKKPHPFPLALNIGTDIVHLPRIARLVSRPNGYLTRFTRRILNEQEQTDFRKRFNLPPGSDVPLESKLYPTPRGINVTAGGGAGAGAGRNTSGGGSGNAGADISTDMARWLAGRFAAKEAARKAAPGGAVTIGWKDVEIRVVEEQQQKQGQQGQEGGEEGRTRAKEDRERIVGRRNTGSERGRPEIVYLDPEGGSGRIGKLSISHDGEYVVATVLAAH